MAFLGMAINPLGCSCCFCLGFLRADLSAGLLLEAEGKPLPSRSAAARLPVEPAVREVRTCKEAAEMFLPRIMLPLFDIESQQYSKIPG